MTDPAIKAALRAGYSAINRETDCTITEGEFAIGASAFLRALPERYIVPTDDGGLVAVNAHKIAAAVERAAKEEGYGR